ncbi:MULTISPECIES: hypothetical protein [unclassified Variovorax]|jgi:hypothetical protein|nr:MULTISPECIES: hypothetical protein [unclassified Variovorax]RSZ39934.1 hypothetical protein EJO70_18390 [Variovorax sp. 553]RSZ40360.1 hypothetical protein EJO71_15825 [Variovorax sp. 679]
MNIVCDLFLPTPVQGDTPWLKRLTLVHREFVPQPERAYVGFLGLNASRLIAVAHVTMARKDGIAILNIPVRYRDSTRLSEAEAMAVASRQHPEWRLSMKAKYPGLENPMFYAFSYSPVDPEPSDDDRAGGGNVAIDSLDGHAWLGDEMGIYHYDYCNLL